MFFNRKEKRSIETGVDRIRNLLKTDNSEDYIDTESTYYSCIKIISESIAKTSIKIKKNNKDIQHKWSDCLTLRANPNMSITDCMQTLVRYTKHFGLGALYIDYTNRHLYPVRINSIIIDNIGLIKSTKMNKVMYVVEDSANTLYDVTEDNLIILKDNPVNGIECRSTRDICSTSLKSAISANRYLKDLFGNGLTNKLIVQLVSDVQEEGKLAEIQARFNKMFSAKGRILTVPAMYRVEPLNLSLADSQFGHNIFMLYNHDWDKPLGDTETNTLKLEVDNIGLRFSLTIDNTVTYAKDVYQLVKKNLIKGCSFGFYVNEDEWSTNNNMEDIRTLLNITLLECTLTPIPAYNETKATCRSYENYKNDLEQHKQNKLLQRKLKLELELM